MAQVRCFCLEAYVRLCPNRRGLKSEPPILQCFGKSIKEVEQVEDGPAGTSKQGMFYGALSRILELGAVRRQREG